MIILNLALRFMLELLGVAALAFWGLNAVADGPGRYVAGIGAPLALIVVWALVAAPKADNGLAPAMRQRIGTVLLLIAAAALAQAGQPAAAALLAITVIANQVLLGILDPGATAVVDRMAGPRS